MARSDLRFPLLAALAVALVMVAGSPPRLVGDGHEYVAQALNFARFTGPSIDQRVFPWLQRRLIAIEPRFATLDLERTAPAEKDGRRDFVHFWFYSALASPLVWLADEAGINPVHAFTLVNLLLLGLALRLALPSIGPPACLLVFGGPIVWWIDKAHTEAFTFALLMIAMVSANRRPWWSMVALGAAATQNPPIAFGLLALAGIDVWRRPAVRRQWTFWAGLAAGLALTALHPLYYLARYGRLSLLTANLHIGWPSAAAFFTTVSDPQIGLAGNFPVLLLAIAAGAVLLARTAPGELVARDVAAAGLAGLFYMYSAAQAFNVHHGGTPSISRYALWLVPMSVPLLTRIQLLRPRRWRRLFWGAAVASAAVSCWAFHPGVGENSREPTLLASVIWRHLPEWSNPVPEVFSETVSNQDTPFLLAPVATRNCEKVLVAGRGPGMPSWPLPCPPAAVAPRCALPLALCYANVTRTGYRFAVSASRYNPGLIRIQRSWPASSETFVQTVFNQMDWRTLDNTGSRPPIVGDVRQVGRVWTWLGRDRLLMVLDSTGGKPAVVLRPDLPMTGRLFDVTTMTTVRELDTAGVGGPDWEIPLPKHADILLLTLRIR